VTRAGLAVLERLPALGRYFIAATRDVGRLPI